jgi:hypothetical protein
MGRLRLVLVGHSLAIWCRRDSPPLLIPGQRGGTDAFCASRAAAAGSRS